MAYQIVNQRLAIWRYALPRPGKRLPTPKCVAESSEAQAAPAFAPDGLHFAFASDRTGHYEIYTADRDGREVLQLTSFGSGMAGWPRWSPDGRWIALDARTGKYAQIFVVDAQGGTPKPLTTGPGEAILPEWSADGQWIYFTRMEANGEHDLWRIPSSGGTPVRMTTTGRWFGFPSPDGMTLYTGQYNGSGIDSMPVGGGSETRVSNDASPAWIANARTGFYYVTQGPDRSMRQLMYYGYARKRAEPVMLFERPLVSPGLSVSPDEADALVAQNDGFVSQVMLVSNFR